MKTTICNRILVASATVMSAILLFQLGGVPERQAIAAPAAVDVASAGDYTMLTLPTSSEDVLLVLDGRNETLFVYHVKNKNTFELISGGDLRSLFAAGKRRGAGGN